MRQFLAAACIIAASICVTPVASSAQSAANTQSGAGAAQPGATTPKQTTPAGKRKELTPQQKKMKDCSREAKFKGYKGDQRKQFMSTCLSD